MLACTEMPAKEQGRRQDGYAHNDITAGRARRHRQLHYRAIHARHDARQALARHDRLNLARGGREVARLRALVGF